MSVVAVWPVAEAVLEERTKNSTEIASRVKHTRFYSEVEGESATWVTVNQQGYPPGLLDERRTEPVLSPRSSSRP